MSLFRQLTRNIASGYSSLAAASLYQLAQVPLALAFLTKREYGLWGLITQLAAYLALIDLGMSASVGRSLFDHKHNRASGAYGSVVKTGFLVLIVQGLLILGVGYAVAPALASFSKIPPDLSETFIRIMRLQCAVTALGFTTKMLPNLLVAHHRYEINNHVTSVVLLINLLMLWIFFHLGYKLMSLPMASAISWILTSMSQAFACSWLRLYPGTGAWGRASWVRFKELFLYGKDVSLITIGNQFILASQTIVVQRVMGLDAVAIWTVCTKTYALVSQLVWRIYDLSGSVFVDMIVRNEKEKLLHRFKSMVTVTAAFAVVAGIMFAICNAPLVTVWTSGRFQWSATNNWLLGLWLIILSILRCHNGLILFTREIGFLRYVYFVEGIVFFVLGSTAARHWGFSAMIGTSIICSLLFSASYGVWRNAKYFATNLREVAGRWLWPAAKVALVLAPIAVALSIATTRLSALAQLVINGAVAGVAGLLLLARMGVPAPLKVEISGRSPARFRPVVAWLLG